jgi:hypothetical protein
MIASTLANIQHILLHYQSVTITAFRTPFDENCTTLGYYVSSGNFLTKFWGKLIVPETQNNKLLVLDISGKRTEPLFKGRFP